MVEEGEGITEHTEKVYRIGKSKGSRTKPRKIRFMSQTPAEHVLQRTGKLAKKEGMKEI